MQNIWVLARWLFTRRPGKGRHKLIPALLRFHRYCALLIRAIERLFLPAPMSRFLPSQTRRYFRDLLKLVDAAARTGAKISIGTFVSNFLGSLQTQ
jgi:hypothetical protein